MKKILWVIFMISLLSLIGSLYYGWFGDPFLNIKTGELFLRSNGLEPCEMCWFARIFMYPLVITSWVGLYKKSFDYLSAIILSWFGILLEWYQYRFQMTKSDTEVTSFICNWIDKASCSSIDVIYWWFITIPFLCLIAFCMIFGASWHYRHLYYKKAK